MIATFLRQLQSMTDAKPQSWVARQTGITAASLRQLQKGAISPTAKWMNNIKHAYRRYAYNTLRSVGLSSANARMLSTYSVQAVDMYEALYKQTLADFTIGAVGAKISSLDLKVTSYQVDKYFDDMYGKVRDGIENAGRSFEDIVEGQVS